MASSAVIPKTHPKRKTAARAGSPRSRGPLPAKGEPIAAARAKAQLLQLLDEVEQTRRPITITKRGRVVAQLVPAPEEKKISAFDQVFGSMRGTGTIAGDIVSPDWESWGLEWR